jgi:hypothetical protein
MTWTLSRFRAGDLVEVRGRKEILATLDEHGCVEGMPFMPEMLQFCGRRFRVSAVAHKTCDTARQTWKNRRLQATVHLAGLRCDGSAHGGCQAECNLFWKDVWLKPAAGDQNDSVGPVVETENSVASVCTETQLLANTRFAPPEEEEPRYACQATKLYDATQSLAWWDVRQYVFDVVTRNHAVGRVLRVTWLGLLRWLLSCVPFGYRLFRWFTEWMYRVLARRSIPSIEGRIKRGAPTPVDRLDLKPGEYVRIKSQSEIEQTLDGRGRNRGLSFDAEEMAPYCGKVFRVRKCVAQIIDEPTGKMRRMKQPCIILEGVVCRGEFATCRLNCPRAIPSYWREIWLERVETPMSAVDVGKSESGASALELQTSAAEGQPV